MPQFAEVPDGGAASRATEDQEHLALDRTWSRVPGLIGWITTTNHKDIGLRFIVTAMVFFGLAGILALLMRTQLARPENTFLGPDLYNQIFTTHGTTMMFLFAVPVMEGMGLYFVPLMIGTRNVSFPRLMNFGYYVYLIAGVFLYVSLLLDIGPDSGWFSYVPLAGPEFTPGKRTDVWSQVVTLMEISSLVGAIEIITTVFKQRAPGMSLNRIPLFVWAQVITSFMIIFAMPAVMLSSTMLSMDRLTNVGTHFFNQAEGGDPLLWQHLFWFFAHPEVYIIFIPATGFVSTIIPAMCRRKTFGYTAIVLSMVATAFIGFGVWVHHMFTTPLPKLGQGMFTASSLLITIPNGVQIFCWTATLWGGKPRIKTPLLFVLGFFAIFIIGGLTGVMLAAVSIDLQVHDTFFVVAHLHYVLIGGALFPLFGAFYYWFPKWTGHMLSETVGWWNFALLFIGFNLTFFPMHQLGLQGMPRRVYSYIPETGWGDLNLLATIGAGLLGIGVLVFIGNVLWSRRRGLVAGDDPWGAGTLEWATSSPPPPYNFRHPPTVRGRYAMWENTPDTPVITGLSLDNREVLCTTIHDAAPEHRYHIASDALWPLALAIGVCATEIGLIFHPISFVIGAALMLVVLAGWFWPTKEPKPIHHPHGHHPGVGGLKRTGGRTMLDVKHLPPVVFDSRAPVWWGNTLLILIETTTIALLVASYFYVRQNYDYWPPPRVNTAPAIFHPAPDWLIATLNVLLLVASCLPMIWVDRAARRQDSFRVLLGLSVIAAVGVVSIALRVFEFPALKFYWNDNAYASIVWSILGLHAIYLAVATVEVALIGLWTFLYGLDERHAVDVTLAAEYWYWMAGIGVPMYAVVYWTPRIL